MRRDRTALSRSGRVVEESKEREALGNPCALPPLDPLHLNPSPPHYPAPALGSARSGADGQICESRYREPSSVALEPRTPRPCDNDDDEETGAGARLRVREGMGGISPSGLSSLP
jgi:hypothetical protein